MGKTTNFGLNKFGQEGRISDEAYKFSLKDRELLDSLLYTLYNHDHRPTTSVSFNGPGWRPSLTLVTSGGTLPSGSTFYYRISYIDSDGNETEASTSEVQATPDPLFPPGATTLATATTGGSLTAGTYKYALAFYQGSTSTRAPNISTINVPSGTATNTVTIDLPSPPGDADGWKIYRRGPGDLEYWLLDTVAAAATPQAEYEDDGSQSPDCTKKRPTINDTNSSNSIDIDINAQDLPLDSGITGWRIYRTNVAGVYGSTSLLETVTQTTTQGGSDLVTTTTDVGNATLLGRPLDQTAVPPTIPQLDASGIWSSSSDPLDPAVTPRGVQYHNTWINGKVTNATDYNQWVPKEDMYLHRIDAFFQDAPDGDGSNYSTIRVSDNGTNNEIQYVWNNSGTIIEVQKLYTIATSGTFTLSWAGQGPTAALDFDALASEIEAELELFSNITTVDVTGSGTVSDPWYVVFLEATGSPGDLALMTTAGTAAPTITEHTAGFDGGTFTLTFEGQTTGAIDWDAPGPPLATPDTTSVEEKLEGISTITAVTVTGTGTESDPWLVEFVNPGSEDVEVMQGTPSMGGNSLAIGVVEEGYGSTSVDIDATGTTANLNWDSGIDNWPVEVEAEDASPGGGTQVSDAVATNDVAMYLDAQNEVCDTNVGFVAAGSYTARFWVRDLDGTADFDIAVIDVDPATPVDILRTNISLHRTTYEPAFELKFTSDGTEDIQLSVKKTDTGTDQVRVDKFDMTIDLPILHAGATCKVEGLVTGTPTDAGGDVNVNVLY